MKIFKILKNTDFRNARIIIYISLAISYLFLLLFYKVQCTGCPLCGMTRATTCLLKLKFHEAYNYNNKVVFILILIIFIIFDLSSLIFYYLKNKINK